MPGKKIISSFGQAGKNFRTVLESAPDAVVIVDENGTIVLVNGQTEKLFGYKREELYDCNVEKLIPQRFHARHSEHRKQFTAAPRIRPMGQGKELFGIQKNGKEFPIEISLSPLETEDGRFIFSAIRDVTEQKKIADEIKSVNAELEEAERKFRAIIESAPDAMVIVDEQGKIKLVNEQTEKIFGYKRNELLDKHVEKLIPQRFHAQHTGYREQFTAEPHIRPMGLGKELYGIRKNGEEFPVEISLSPLETSEGRFISSSIRDVTLQKQAADQIKEFNAQLKKHADELEKSNLELKQFAYIVSHDLQSPLRNISGFVQLLQQTYKEKIDEQADDWINRTVKNTKKMEMIIHDILAYSRIGSRARPFQITDLNEVLTEVMSTLESSINDANAVITYDKLPTVMGDPSQLAHVFQNLIGNGIKYQSKKTPHVNITAKKNKTEYIISVSDNGIGIDPQYHDRIFEIFKRLHTHQEYPGTGIGLSICRRILDRHGGKIWAESEPGKGSKFYFTLKQIDDKGEN